MADNGCSKNEMSLNCNGMCGCFRALVILAMLLVTHLAWADRTVAAETAATSGRPTSSSLFERQPLGFDQQTADRMATTLRNLPGEAPKLIEFARGQRRVLGHGGGALMLLLALAIGYGIYGRVRLSNWIKAALAPLFERIPSAGNQWPASIAELLAATLLWISYRGEHGRS